jgi:hypothetical protein
MYYVPFFNNNRNHRPGTVLIKTFLKLTNLLCLISVIYQFALCILYTFLIILILVTRHSAPSYMNFFDVLDTFLNDFTESAIMLCLSIVIFSVLNSIPQ